MNRVQKTVSPQCHTNSVMSPTMLEVFLFFLIFPIIHSDWVKLEPLPQTAPKFMKGEQFTDSEPVDCYQDIHSWTAETWGTRHNNSQQEDAPDSGMPRSSEGKMMVLKAAHDRLINQIYDQATQIGAREARGHKGMMGSTEGALITISLLTFAVYLIKLVLMLVHAVHEKKGHGKGNQLMSTALPASVQTILLNQGRRRRFADHFLQPTMNDLNYS